ARIRFLSCEPLLGPVDLSSWIASKKSYPIDWVIAGGESGPHARPMHPAWAKDLVGQCNRAGISFHFKQWGHWAPAESAARDALTQTITFEDSPPVKMAKLGKKEAGRVLDGATWDQVPAV